MPFCGEIRRIGETVETGTDGPGARTALKIGALVGFASGFRTNFATATWAAIPRMFPLGWMLELWVGSIL
jgi:hypothetical protein